MLMCVNVCMYPYLDLCMYVGMDGCLYAYIAPNLYEEKRTQSKSTKD